MVAAVAAALKPAFRPVGGGSSGDIGDAMPVTAGRRWWQEEIAAALPTATAMPVPGPMLRRVALTSTPRK